MTAARRPARRPALASLLGLGLGCAAIVGWAEARDYNKPRDPNEPTPTVDDATRLEDASRHLNAQRTTPTPGLTDAAGRPIPQPPPVLAEPVPEAMEGVGVVEKLGATVPTDIAFTDQDGNPVTLGDYLNDGKPVLLNPIYYKCPMLCGLISQGLTDALRHVKFDPGDDFTIVSVSFNPDESPELARANADATFARLARPEAQDGWHHLVGDQENIDRLLDAIGFTVKLQPDGEYAHPAAVVMVSPSGTITRYVVPTEPNSGFNTNTLRRAIVEAGEGTVGSPLEVLIQTCLQFNHATGEYQLAMGVMRAGAVATILVLAGGIVGMIWFERRRRSPRPPAQPPTPATA